MSAGDFGTVATARPDPRAVAEFLRAYPPFDGLDPEAVDRVGEAIEIERVPAGATILRPDATPVSDLRVVRRGAVELVAGGRPLDLLGEGEMFGQASMFSGLPPGFEARAAEETVCYRIPRAVAEQALSAPAGLRYVARSVMAGTAPLPGVVSQPVRNLADEPVGSLLAGEPVICAPDTPIRAAAERMSAAHVSAIVVDRGGGALGIVTERDLRTRVVAAGLSGEQPVAQVMTAPAYTATPDRPASEVVFEMLDRGIRHYPVVDATGRILGVVEAADLLMARTRSSFALRQRIAAARTEAELADVARDLRPMVISLHDSRVAAANLVAVYSIVVDALTRRLLELALAREEDFPEMEFAWLALGSQARREALPSSDVDSAVVWLGDEPEANIRPRLVALCDRVIAGLRRCGLRIDTHGASASEAPFVRSRTSWDRLIHSLITDPNQEKALILTSVLIDSRPVWGVHTGTPVSDAFGLAPRAPELLRLMARFALSHRPPTGFWRGLVVEHSGEHRGRLDLKLGGVVPIVDLARWAGMAAGVTTASTAERLRAAAAAGTLPAAAADSLRDAFWLIQDVRADHQVRQLRAGREPDDHLDPRDLSPLMRTQLKEAFRAVSSVQRHLAAELSVGVS